MIFASSRLLTSNVESFQTSPACSLVAGREPSQHDRSTATRRGSDSRSGPKAVAERAQANSTVTAVEPSELTSASNLALRQGVSAWYASDFQSPDTFTYHLTPKDIAELEAAANGVEHKETKDITKSDFPLPTFGPKLEALREEVVNGRGFYLIQGLPVVTYSVAKSVLIYWGMGLYWGHAVSQNAKGHLIGHVKDIDLPGGHKDPVNRVYATHGAQPYHCDPADVVGLLCLKQAKSGGLSSWASSVTAHNELLRRRPDLAEVMTQGWFLDRKNEVPPGKDPWFVVPPFNYHEGKLAIFYENGFYQSAERHEQVPKLTQQQHEAISVFDEIASSDKLRLDYVLQPGDIQLLHNHQIVHTRSEYEDFEDPAERRHLLRIWVAPPDGWPLPEAFAERYGSTTIGERGGICVPGYAPRIALEAD
ncbi:hypothetical protein WJX84_004664 [Apatococcus fuscideae]|uniref:TauD/TfdA-like domain-containing protein n=1 Tax=Apatococcus fuscideae TaxID=2026836 RepID=A0AAW1SUX5_9CHLO